MQGHEADTVHIPTYRFCNLQDLLCELATQPQHQATRRSIASISPPKQQPTLIHIWVTVPWGASNIEPWCAQRTALSSSDTHHTAVASWQKLLGKALAHFASAEGELPRRATRASCSKSIRRPWPPRALGVFLTQRFLLAQPLSALAVIVDAIALVVPSARNCKLRPALRRGRLRRGPRACPTSRPGRQGRGLVWWQGCRAAGSRRAWRSGAAWQGCLGGSLWCEVSPPPRWPLLRGVASGWGGAAAWPGTAVARVHWRTGRL